MLREIIVIMLADNPSACEHEQGFVSIDDGESGIAVANIGLYEYEMLPDMNNTLAITLLRATYEMVIGEYSRHLRHSV